MSNNTNIIVDSPQNINNNIVDAEMEAWLADPDNADPDAERNGPLPLDNDEDIQKILLGAILTNIDALSHSSRFIDPKSFTVKGASTAVRIVHEYYERYKASPTLQVVRDELKQSLQDAKSLPYYHAMIDTSCWDFKNYDYPIEYINDLIEQHAKKSAFIAMTQATLKEAKKPKADFSKITEQYTKQVRAIEESFNPDQKRQCYTLGELEDLPELTWIIEKHLYTGCFATVYGPSGSGKSFVCLDYALCVATGTQYLDQYPVKQGKVLYICSEGQLGIKNRAKAWMQHNDITDVSNIVFLPASFDLMKLGEAKEILDLAVKKFGCNPDFIVIDTLSRNIGAGDDRTNDINLYITNVDYLRSETGATVVSVHHTGHENTKRPRGAANLIDASDVMLRVLPRSPEDVAHNTESKIHQFKIKEDQGFPDYSLEKQIVTLPDGAVSCVWTLQDVAEQVDAKLAEILDLIPVLSLTEQANEENTITATQLKSQIGLSAGEISKRLSSLRDRDQVYRDKFGSGNASKLPFRYWQVPELQS